jgi:hypothetical protein
METLIAKYRAARTTANAQKLVAYLTRHSMALCFATLSDLIAIEDAKDLLRGKEEAAAGLVTIRSAFL